MTNEEKIMRLEARKHLLEQTGDKNKNILNKIYRSLRKLKADKE